MHFIPMLANIVTYIFSQQRKDKGKNYSFDAKQRSFPFTIINNLPSFGSATIPKFVSSYGQEINSVLIFVTY
jgi:hypothetical protein